MAHQSGTACSQARRAWKTSAANRLLAAFRSKLHPAGQHSASQNLPPPVPQKLLGIHG
jgi:hypothetical protein